MGISPWTDVVMDNELENGVSGSSNILEEVQKVTQDNKADVFLKILNDFNCLLSRYGLFFYFSKMAYWDFGNRLVCYQFLDLSWFFFFGGFFNCCGIDIPTLQIHW